MTVMGHYQMGMPEYLPWAQTPCGESSQALPWPEPVLWLDCPCDDKMHLCKNHQWSLKKRFISHKSWWVHSMPKRQSGCRKRGREGARPWGSAFIGVPEQDVWSIACSLFIGKFKTQPWELGHGKGTAGSPKHYIVKVSQQFGTGKLEGWPGFSPSCFTSSCVRELATCLFVRTSLRWMPQQPEA